MGQLQDGWSTSGQQVEEGWEGDLWSLLDPDRPLLPILSDSDLAVLPASPMDDLDAAREAGIQAPVKFL